MRWLNDGRGLVFLVALFAMSPMAAVLGQGVDSAAFDTAALNQEAAADGIRLYRERGPLLGENRFDGLGGRFGQSAGMHRDAAGLGFEAIGLFLNRGL